MVAIDSSRAKFPPGGMGLEIARTRMFAEEAVALNPCPCLSPWFVAVSTCRPIDCGDLW